MKKKILIALGCLALIPVLSIAALVAIREPPDGPRVDVAAGVVGVEAGGAYAYVIRTSAGAVLVDAGLDATGAALLAELKAQGVTPGQVSAVLLTHGHPDHYAAAVLFEKATIVAGAGDHAMIRGDRSHYATFGKVLGAVMPLPPPPSGLTPVTGGEQLRFDDAVVTVIATPGHSPGSVMYQYREVLFTGDSLMRKKDGLTIVPSLFSEDRDRNRRSLAALEPLAFTIVADGHAGVARDAKAKLLRFMSGR